MDRIDMEILELLKINSRVTVSDVSKKINLSIPAVSDRMKKLEEKGVIQQYTTILSRKEMGYGILAFIFVSIERTESAAIFKEKIQNFKHVLECHHIAGEFDYLLKVTAKDTEDLETFITEDLKEVASVYKSRTNIVFSSMKETYSV